MSVNPVFEVITLASVALGGALVLSVSQQRITAGDALHLHWLLGTFLSGLLTFYVPYPLVLRYSLAMSGIPTLAKMMDWAFGQRVVPMHYGAGGAPAEPGPGQPRQHQQ